MFNMILVSAGAIILFYSTWLCYKLNNSVKNNTAANHYWVLLALICLFIFGYLAFFARLIYSPVHTTNELLVSVIFFFGAIFVVTVLKINNRLIYDLMRKSADLKKLNSDMENKNRELRNQTEELKSSKQKYKERSMELDKTLEDFYTLRLGMARDIKEKILEEENKKIKERLDKLRSEND